MPHPITKKSIKREKGNVLFMILLAVALFAALAYAVTGSTRSGGGDASQETSILASSQITQHLSSIKQSIIRLKISNECRDDQISFTTTIYPQTNPNAPADKRCDVFHPSGGNISQVTFPVEFFDQSKFQVGTLWQTYFGYGGHMNYRINYNTNNRWVNIGTHTNIE